MRKRTKPTLNKVGDPFVGPVVFVDGFHYPVGDDGHGILTQPLVVTLEDGVEVFRWGNDVSPKHNHVYERQVVEVVPFSEDAA